MVRIVVVGANGQVASEVVLLLRRLGGIQVLPVVRTHGGSAFLRYCGVPVAHGAITDPATAPRLLAGADVVANFALASGTPSETLSQNDRIIHATFDYAPRDATIVFFSTLAVDGSFTEDGQRQRNAYGDIKLRNERLVEKLAASSARRAFILRLGHVAGSLQGITDVVRRDIASPPAVLPDPDRHSNLTYTAAIADALDAIATGRASAPGKYDLVNVPQWTWREIYQWEADAMGASLHLERCVLPTTTQSARGLMRSVLGAGKRLASKETLSRLAVLLPQNTNQRLVAEHYLSRARTELAELQPPTVVRNQAAYWPALPIRAMLGLKPTRALLQSHGPIDPALLTGRWPPDVTLPES